MRRSTFPVLRWKFSVLLALAIAASVLTPAQAAARSFLWKVTGKNGGVVYLAGSVHMLTPAHYPLAPAFDAAYKDSDLLVEELDMAELLAPTTQMAFLSKGMLSSDQSLDKLVSPATLALVNKALADLGPAGEMLKKFKPWLLAMTLEQLEMQKAGYDASLGLDKHFYDRAQENNKSVQGLETAEYQISRFEGLTMEQQDHLLAETLKQLETEKTSITRLLDAWKSGDAPTVEKIVLADLKNDPVLYQRLLVERNRNWLPKIDDLFARKGRAFVVVGAAHLVGPDGLLSMLKGKGYTIEQQ
jgi:uncharacterized protein YbaP (TraB family)